MNRHTGNGANSIKTLEVTIIAVVVVALSRDCAISRQAISYL